MEKKNISRSLFVTFILALAIFPLLMIFLPNKAKNNTNSAKNDNQLLIKIQKNLLYPTPMPTQIPVFSGITKTISLTPQPTLVALIQAQDVDDWRTYKRNDDIGAGFSFSYPSSWQVTYKKGSSQANNYQFLFMLAKQSQIMTIGIYPPVSSVETFIKTYYADKLLYEPFGKIGSEIVYRLDRKSTISPSDPLVTNFGSRGLIFEKQHAYTISFDTNDDHTMIEAIEKNIWSTFQFK